MSLSQTKERRQDFRNWTPVLDWIIQVAKQVLQDILLWSPSHARKLKAAETAWGSRSLSYRQGFLEFLGVLIRVYFVRLDQDWFWHYKSADYEFTSDYTSVKRRLVVRDAEGSRATKAKNCSCTGMRKTTTPGSNQVNPPCSRESDWRGRKFRSRIRPNLKSLGAYRQKLKGCKSMCGVFKTVRRA